ncbi:hypothetical protein BMETH_592_1 [methanotrophic bacterial endosymbiont of Bathymodiolus sp.]|nr:hypothetical protein BMETH_592_1 [methanotrophic bacterial endosymbiont of Bathymodiolus sp.]
MSPSLEPVALVYLQQQRPNSVSCALQQPQNQRQELSLMRQSLPRVCVLMGMRVTQN